MNRKGPEISEGGSRRGDGGRRAGKGEAVTGGDEGDAGAGWGQLEGKRGAEAIALEQGPGVRLPILTQTPPPPPPPARPGALLGVSCLKPSPSARHPHGSPCHNRVPACHPRRPDHRLWTACSSKGRPEPAPRRQGVGPRMAPGRMPQIPGPAASSVNPQRSGQSWASGHSPAPTPQTLCPLVGLLSINAITTPQVLRPRAPSP